MNILSFALSVIALALSASAVTLAVYLYLAKKGQIKNTLCKG